MTFIAWALGIAALVANALAIRALFARDRLQTWMRRCFTAAALLFGGIALATFAALLADPPASSMTGEKARLLAETLSFVINDVVVAAVTCALPLIAGFVLLSRARRSKNS
jgi:hypothetical protein